MTFGLGLMAAGSYLVQTRPELNGVVSQIFEFHFQPGFDMP